MSNYTPTTAFGPKDALANGDPAKVILGTQIDTEYNNIATSISTKQDTSSAATLAGNNAWTGLNSFTAPVPGSSYSVAVQNTSTTAGSNALLIASVAPGSAGNPSLVLDVAGVQDWYVGVQTSLNQVATGLGTSPGTADRFVVGVNYIKGYGPTLGSLVDMTPDSGTFAITAANFATGGTGTAHWSRKGNQATLFIPLLTGTSNGTGFAFSLPTQLQSTISSQFVAVPSALTSDNGATVTDCSLNITSTQAQFYHSFSATGWTGSGTKATGPMTVTFLLS